MNIRIVSEKISQDIVQEAAAAWYGNMVKAVVDIEKKVIALGGEMHSDAEQLLLQQGSRHEDLWGFNLYPDEPRGDWIQYTSLINIRPHAGNKSMEIEDKNIREKIREIVDSLII